MDPLQPKNGLSTDAMKQLKCANILRLANMIAWSVIHFLLPSILYYIMSLPIAPALTNG
jgi:uncharacterized membrane protein